MFDKSENRFTVIYQQGTFKDFIRILKDNETGVCYLSSKCGSSGGLTPLLDSSGNPAKM